MTIRTAMMGMTLALGLAACGKKEVNKMTEYANEMCACKDSKCADAVFPKIEAFTKANEGKEVPAAMADAYNRKLERTQKCHDKLVESAPPPTE
jgi:hypothetical protein